ncbi:histidine kinase [Sphingomonas sp. AP4-R1]|uniref:sensor histidine kinase n=1 Tax=Sphingomonas sp. AP4-R1 TaxID=2735134 RepID=UPI001493A7F5|nr:histidine kinase [Sphingomonas sp. AP4-R1]QJU60038.1 histidine kinase [Sphingomonas sp. AP4-R1]
MYESPVTPAGIRPLAEAAKRADDGRQDRMWREGAVVTVALWSFTLLIYLPIILNRYEGMGMTSVLLDSSTILVSMAFAMGLFALFRAIHSLRRRVQVGIMILAVFAIAIVQSAFDLLFTGFVAHTLEARWLALPDDLLQSYGAAFNYAAVFAVNCALFQLAAGRRRAIRQERELVHLRASAKQAELDALRLKFNPHFLFNTLNAISAMVVTARNAEAEQGIETLSAFLRASIETDPDAVAPLEDQLQLVDHYLQLEEMRFGDRLDVIFDTPDEVGSVIVPSLLIQPLVEAAIRDAVEPSSTPVRIRIAAQRKAGGLELSVSDDAPRAQTRDGVMAVETVRGRLGALFGGAASVVVRSGDRGVETILHVPAAG